MFKRLKNWMVDRLKERSTWRGIITTLTGAGLVSLDPGMQEAVITTGLATFGAVEVVFKENKKQDKKENE